MVLKTLKRAKQLQEQMEAVRRHLHMYPELSFEEYETSRLVQNKLSDLGIPFYTVDGTTCVIGIIQGVRPGKTIVLRADMDALPIRELNDDCPFKSQVDGRMHACGHDGHVSALLGAAQILTEMRDEICGTVKLVFESGEEYGGTFQKMDEAGVFDDVDHCFGIHIWSEVPAGKIACSAGGRMAGTDLLNLRITGVGSHGAQPHLGVDAGVAAAAIIMNLQTIVSRELDPQETAVVTIGKFAAGQRFNSIPDEAILEGNLRYFRPELSDKYPQIINRIAENTAAAFRAKSEMILHEIGTPPVVNSPEAVIFGQKVIKKLFGEDALYDLPPLMAGEDFAFYINKCGGLFVFVGGGSQYRKSWPHHNGHFDIDESSLTLSAALHAQYAIDYLNENE
jgi:amidohydrolase